MAWLANHATIDVHPWTSRIDAYRTPTYALIDIDPGEKTTWDDVLTLTRLYKTALEHLKVTGLPKVTGKRGIQIWVPVKPIYSYRETSGWVETLSRAIGAAVPKLVSLGLGQGVAQRSGAARLHAERGQQDARRAVRGAARSPDAAVSAPITWDELDDPELRPGRWNIESILPRIEERGDLFAPALTVQQELPPIE